MSVEVWALALNAKIGNPAKKAVLLGLANHADPEGHHCFPSVARLAIYAELGESTVRTKLAELRSEKTIKVDKRASRYRPTEYSIDLDRLHELRNRDLQQLKASKGAPISRYPAAGSETSSSSTADLQETTTRPLAGGGEPSVEPLLKPLKEPRAEIQKPSLDQTPLAQAKASLRLEYTNGNIYSKPDPVYDQVFSPLKSAGLVRDGPENKTTIILTHPDPGIFDKQTEAMLRQAFVGVLGGEIEISIVEETGNGI